MPLPPFAPAAFFFDMDNTLVETEWAAARAVKEAVHAHGRSFSREDEEAVIGLPWETIFRSAIATYRLPVDEESFKADVLERKARLLGDDPHLLPGAVEALLRCARRRPVAVVSGSFRHEVLSTLQTLGIAPHVALVVANEDCSPGKPDPGPYLLAARRLGVDPAHGLVFEDSEMGVKSARAAGMKVVAVMKAAMPNADLSPADTRIGSLLDVTDDWLEGLWPDGPGLTPGGRRPPRPGG